METLLPAYSQAMTISYDKPFVGQPSISHQREFPYEFCTENLYIPHNQHPHIG